MKSITINQKSALSILLGAAMFAKDNSLQVKYGASRGTDFKGKFAELYPKEDIVNNPAVNLLESDNSRGDKLAAGILGLHYEIGNFYSYQELMSVFRGDKVAQKRIEDAGAIIIAFTNSPSYIASTGIVDVDVPELKDEEDKA